jgi:protein N-terminal methyltransferase
MRLRCSHVLVWTPCRPLPQVKENNCAEGFVVDKEDSSVTRSNPYFLSLFAKAKLVVLKTKLQKGFPSELFAVRMYALKPQ